MSESKDDHEIRSIDCYDAKSIGSDKKDDSQASYISISIESLTISPNDFVNIEDPLFLSINFDLDRTVSDAFWVLKFLVDSCDKRIIRILGETSPTMYTRGSSIVVFRVGRIDVSGIVPSILANSGLLIAELVVGSESVAAVNMVVNVKKDINGGIKREIFSPLD